MLSLAKYKPRPLCFLNSQADILFLSSFWAVVLVIGDVPAWIQPLVLIWSSCRIGEPDGNGLLMRTKLTLIWGHLFGIKCLSLIAWILIHILGFLTSFLVYFCVLNCLLYCHCCLNTTNCWIERALQTRLQMFLLLLCRSWLRSWELTQKGLQNTWNFRNCLSALMHREHGYRPWRTLICA